MVKNANCIHFWKRREICYGARLKSLLDDGAIRAPHLMENTEPPANGSDLFLDRCVFQSPVGF